MFTERKRFSVSGWPFVEAVFQAKGSTRWVPFHPMFRVLPSLRLMHEEERANHGGPEARPLTVETAEVLRLAAERRHALLHFQHAFPPQIAKPVGRMPRDQWSVLRLLRSDKQLIQLLGISPALVYLLALRLGGPGSSEEPLAVSQLRQRELLDRLGWPSSEAIARIVRKVEPAALGRENLDRLRKALESPETVKALSHLPVVTREIIPLVSDPILFRSIAPALLGELAADGEGVDAAGFATLLRETLRMQAALQPGSEVRMESVAQLRRLHDDLLHDYARWVEARLQRGKFPPPPLPGVPDWIVPLDCTEELFQEGRQQSNCVASHAARVREGREFIYRVLRPERATLSVAMNPEGRWEIDQLLASCNRSVSRRTWEFVEEWIERWSMDDSRPRS